MSGCKWYIWKAILPDLGKTICQRRSTHDWFLTTVIPRLGSAPLVCIFKLHILELYILNLYIQRRLWHPHHTSLNIQASSEVLKIPRLHPAETPNLRRDSYWAFNSGFFKCKPCLILTCNGWDAQRKGNSSGNQYLWCVPGTLLPFNFTKNI